MKRDRLTAGSSGQTRNDEAWGRGRRSTSKRVCSLPSEMGRCPQLQGSTLYLHCLLADSSTQSAFLARLRGGARDLWVFPTYKEKMPLEEQHINHTKFFMC